MLSNTDQKRRWRKRNRSTYIDMMMSLPPCTMMILLLLIHTVMISTNNCYYNVYSFIITSSKLSPMSFLTTKQNKLLLMNMSTDHNNDDNNNNNNKTKVIINTTIRRRRKIQQSAFGKAAIGLDKRRERMTRSLLSMRMMKEKIKANTIAATAAAATTTTTTTTNPQSNTNRKSSTKVIPSSQHISNQDIIHKNESEIEIMLSQRDAALVALKTHLQLSLKQSLDILNAYPSLYTDLDDLSNKLLYLLHDINIKPKQLKRMLISHPRLMENVLLDSKDNITNTVEVLQTELGLSLDDIKMIQSKSLPAILSYPRSELRKRILVYKLDLLYPKEEMRKLVLKDPRMLRTDSRNVRQILNVFKEELDIGIEDIHAMLGKDTLLLTYNAEGNIRPTIRYLKEFEVGKCLGMVERKGQSTIKAQSQEERNSIIIERLKALVMSHPTILSSSIEKNLKPTVSFFLNECGLCEYEFGRIIYRRGGSLLCANVDRTLRRKVSFLRENLGLEISKDNIIERGKEDNTLQVDIPQVETTSTESIQPLSTFEKKRLIAQMIATNPDILTLSIENNLQPKFEYFQKDIGFTKEEIRYIVLKRPQLLALSLERNLIPKVQYFLAPRYNNNSDSVSGLGMTMKEIRPWLAQYPQSLTVVLESRIKPRIEDVIQMGLYVGDEILPLNFLTQTERKWKEWKDDLLSSRDEEC